ncbi:hypothetical protein MTO96_010997 [Rhipicephalus appendiculatus]
MLQRRINRPASSDFLLLAAEGCSWRICWVLDASGKIPSGFSDGSLAELGDYDLCIRLVAHKSTLSGAREKLFRGQYCSFTLDPPLPPRPPCDKKYGAHHRQQQFLQHIGAVA